jgi:hypothetical protein
MACAAPTLNEGNQVVWWIIADHEIAGGNINACFELTPMPCPTTHSDGVVHLKLTFLEHIRGDDEILRPITKVLQAGLLGF